ncbi:MAG TPA: hypothetical protein VL426_00065 [Candidatus Binatia bacterium]|nr:hypothetical protein [Candidatus Binatia bacterium]
MPLHEHHRKHIALWVAVGGTMAVIVALWVLILPMQLQDSRFAGFRGAARWSAARADEPSSKPTFSEVLSAQRRTLQDIEKRTGTSSGDTSLKIQELRAKIEAASKKNEIEPPPAPAPAATPAPAPAP